MELYFGQFTKTSKITFFNLNPKFSEFVGDFGPTSTHFVSAIVKMITFFKFLAIVQDIRIFQYFKKFKH